ncbi:MAG TPA: Rieske (2Fe-2S) protein [Polyangiaceae bacterium]|nr:Rieske (2Fe-2S) protein [Polyangiaceae bacterium]
MKNRRTFLKILSASPLLACSAPSGAPAKFGDVSGGNVSATAVGMLAVVPNAPALLARDEQGLYAMTITCTHEGCDIAPSGTILVCPCHGSHFDSNGNVLQGPAGSPLTHFAVVVDAMGDITVQGETQVDASVRTPVA